MYEKRAFDILKPKKAIFSPKNAPNERFPPNSTFPTPIPQDALGIPIFHAKSDSVGPANPN